MDINEMTDEQVKVFENRCRRAAQRQGLYLAKSRRRDPRALDYGNYWLVEGSGANWRGRLVVAGGDHGMSLDAIADELGVKQSD